MIKLLRINQNKFKKFLENKKKNMKHRNKNILKRLHNKLKITTFHIKEVKYIYFSLQIK